MLRRWGCLAGPKTVVPDLGKFHTERTSHDTHWLAGVRTGGLPRIPIPDPPGTPNRFSQQLCSQQQKPGGEPRWYQVDQVVQARRDFAQPFPLGVTVAE